MSPPPPNVVIDAQCHLPDDLALNDFLLMTSIQFFAKMGCHKNGLIVAYAGT
jgi:hypothetical protein